jgi:Leucine-rich repeat (LRR) protein
MTISELSVNLSEAYRLENLNKISVTLINLYKNQQYSVLQKIAELINDFTAIEISPEGKGFNKLIMLYHPDKLTYYQNEIKRRVEKSDFDALLELSHILKLARVEEIATALNSFEDIDYSPLYDWEMETEGFTIIDDSRKAKKTKIQRSDYDFYDAIKMRQYGSTDVEFPSWYLEDIDEFELASSDITNLDGIEFCIHAKTMDLSDNRITDISPLFGLTQLEELNLSDNQVQNIDTLSNLTNLKTVNLSNNQIEDISPLFELEMLTYVDLTGNEVDAEQLKQLKESGVEVDY